MSVRVNPPAPFKVQASPGAITGRAAVLRGGQGPKGDKGDTGPEGPAGGTTATDTVIASRVNDDTSESYKALIKRFGGVITPEFYGAKGDDTNDDAPAIRAAMIASATLGLPCYVRGGKTYRCGSGLNAIRSKLHMVIEGRIVKDFTPGTFLYNESFASRVTDVIIEGSGSIGGRTPGDYSKRGIPVQILGDRVTLRDFTIRTWAGGVAMLLAGDQMRLSNIKAYDSIQEIGNGGIRYCGGNDFDAEGCHVESGDDALQFVPVAATTSPFYDMDINRGRYRNCTGRSYDARFMVAGTVDPAERNDPNITMVAKVSDVGWTDCRGFGGQRGLVVLNVNAVNGVDGVNVQNCTIDMSLSKTMQDDVKLAADLGYVRNVNINGLRVLNARGTTRTLWLGTVSDVILENCDLPVSTNGTPGAIVESLAATNAKIRRNVFRGSGSNAALLFTTGTTSTDIEVENNDFRDIAAAAFAINAPQVVRLTSRGNKFRAVAGAEATARGVRIASTSTDVRVIDNDFRQLTGAAGTKVVNQATTSTFRTNPGYNPFGGITAPAMPASNADYVNTSGYDCSVAIWGGTVTAIRVSTATSAATGLTSGTFRVPAGQSIRITYSVAPSWAWTAD